MDEIEIDKNIPMPDSVRGSRGKWQLLLAKMEVGDSFLMPDNVKKSSMYQLCKPYAKISVRETSEGIRVWLLEKKN